MTTRLSETAPAVLDVQQILNEEGGPTLWQLNAFGTAYRGLAVEVGSSGPSLFGEGGDVLVAVSPAGGKKNLTPARMWHVFRHTTEHVLAQEYVEEKFAVKGEDAVALTVLIAVMLGRKPFLMVEE